MFDGEAIVLSSQQREDSTQTACRYDDTPGDPDQHARHTDWLATDKAVSKRMG